MIQETVGLAAALGAAMQTKLFAALLAGPRSPIDHAHALSLDPRATERVLDVLVAFGLAQKIGDKVGASPELLENLGRAPGGAEMFLGLWSHVPEFLRTGAPFLRMDAGREVAYTSVVGALGRMFSATATTLATKISKPPARILDIGCGSGVWSLAIAQRFPNARVTGLDLPAVLESFRARATELGLVDRIELLPGDVHELAIPRGFDLVVIANVLRIEAPDRARNIVKRAVDALAPDGELLVVDALGGGTPEREQARAIYALHLTMRTEQGRVYSPAEITAWIHDAGLANVTAIDVEGANPGAIGALSGRRA